MIGDRRWQVGDKVKFDARSFQWQDWIGTLRNCELPQIVAYDCVVRIHFIERNGKGDVIAYGRIVSLQTIEHIKQAIEQLAIQLEPEIEVQPDTVISDSSIKLTFKEGAKERLIKERDEMREKSKPSYTEIIRSNIRGYRK